MNDQTECIKNLALHMQHELAELIGRCDRALAEETGAHTPNSARLQCTCYSTSFNSEGSYYLVRNDCPIHKGTLQQPPAFNMWCK